VILLDDQDRSLWDRQLIDEGVRLIRLALSPPSTVAQSRGSDAGPGTRRFGPYAIQAAIAAVHAEASTPSATDWEEIVGLYDALMEVNPSPVVALNRAVAVAMRDGPAAGLALVDEILSSGELADYRLAHAARAEFCRRLGKTGEARTSYQRALKLTRQEPERRFIEKRLRELEAGG